MAFEKGKSGNPGGRWKEKPFREALRMELATAGADQKALRLIARALIGKAQDGDIQAVKEVADRLDGKPAQESTVNVHDKRNATDWSRAELVQFLNDAIDGGEGTVETAGSDREPDSVH